MYTGIKRGVDFVGALILTVCALPFMLAAAIAIKLEDPQGPVLFRQPRPGFQEKIFTIYKFRTMRVATHDETGRPLTDMERMTKSGKILRKLSIDELPQFINILKGDMSFIGPRPLLVQYLKHYNEEQRRRHNVRPGISGWAQVNGRNAISWEEKFQLDVYYADHISFGLDMKIFYLTIKNVLLRKDINESANQTMEVFGE